MDYALWIDDGSGSVRNPELSDEQYAAGLEELKQQNIHDLWESATSYQEAQISGAAIGLLTIGVIQSKPKCFAVMMWVQSVWGTYYTRKAIMTHVYSESDYDFSSCGTMPYTVPEIQVEVLS